MDTPERASLTQDEDGGHMSWDLGNISGFLNSPRLLQHFQTAGVGSEAPPQTPASNMESDCTESELNNSLGEMKRTSYGAHILESSTELVSSTKDKTPSGFKSNMDTAVVSTETAKNKQTCIDVNKAYTIVTTSEETNGQDGKPKIVRKVIIVPPGEDSEDATKRAIEQITTELNRKAEEQLAKGEKPDHETIIEITRIMSSPMKNLPVFSQDASSTKTEDSKAGKIQPKSLIPQLEDGSSMNASQTSAFSAGNFPRQVNQTMSKNSSRLPFFRSVSSPLCHTTDSDKGEDSCDSMDVPLPLTVVTESQSFIEQQAAAKTSAQARPQSSLGLPVSTVQTRPQSSLGLSVSLISASNASTSSVQTSGASILTKSLPTMCASANLRQFQQQQKGVQTGLQLLQLVSKPSLGGTTAKSIITQPSQTSTSGLYQLVGSC
jgi:hypothetical protein